jgi:hypothetical protein
MRTLLTLANLDQVDFGKPSEAVRQALERVVRDCLDRPGDKATRKVELTMLITPRMAQDGDCVDCDVSFEVAAKTPKWKTAARPYMTTRQGQLVFNPDSPDNPAQTTRFGEDAEESEDEA